MNIHLIPDLTNPKWLIMQEILKSIDSNRARKIASRLKIPDVQVFIDCSASSINILEKYNLLFTI